MVAIGMFPNVIAPIIESGMQPVATRVNDAMLATQDIQTVSDSAGQALSGLVRLLGGS